MNKGSFRLILAAVLTVLAASSVFIAVKLTKEPSGIVVISIDGEIIETIDLSGAPDREFEVKTELGSNTVRIKDGRISVVDADCPDRTCVRMGELVSELEPIVCLPHRLIIRFTEVN